MRMMKGKKGLSGTALKAIAAGCMLLDHIAYFFGFTGAIPAVFAMLGRLAAPLFLFCLAEGFAHTHDRRRYFLRIYAMAAAMGALYFAMAYLGLGVRGDGFVPQNGILTAYALLIIVWQGMDWLRERRWLWGALAVAVPLLWPFAAPYISMVLPKALGPVWGLTLFTALPAWGMLGDTSLPVLVTGLLMYPLRGHRRLQALAMALWAFMYHFVFVWRMASGMAGFAPSQMLTVYIEWMEAFSAPLMLCYNGQRGRDAKGFFYAFYPAHVYGLYLLSCLVYPMMMT